MSAYDYMLHTTYNYYFIAAEVLMEEQTVRCHKRDFQARLLYSDISVIGSMATGSE